MSRLFFFRFLLAAFVALYVAVISTSGIPSSMPAEVIAYQSWLESQPLKNSSIWMILFTLGHLADVVGLVLLFTHRRIGVWFLVAGFISCFGIGYSDIPYLQTSLNGSLMALTNITWGAIVTLSLTAYDGLFVQQASITSHVKLFIRKLSQLNYSIVLRVIACVLFISALINLNTAFSLTGTLFGPTYQSRAVVATIILSFVAYGLWKHKKWALWLYISYTVANQILIYLIGWPSSRIWAPLILIMLILVNYKWLNPNPSFKRDA